LHAACLGGEGNALYPVLCCLVYVVCFCSTDNLNLTLILAVAVGGAVAAAVVIATVIGVIWRVLSSSSAAAEPAVVASSPVTVFSKPAVHARFIQSPLYYRPYGGYYNNGYYDNECPIHSRRPYHGRINVHSGQLLFPRF